MIPINAKRIVLAVIRIILFLFFLEMILWGVGAISLRVQDFQNKSQIKNRSEYLIMCVGDSHTYAGGAESYPSQLQKILDESNLPRKYKVLNKGIPAADTTRILKDFDSWMNEYHPDMVIVMMGLNDGVDQVSFKQQSDIQKLDSFFGNIRIYRLWKGLQKQFTQNKAKDNVQEKSVDQEEIRKPVPSQFIKLFEYALALKQQGKLDEATKLFNYLISLDLDPSFTYRLHRELTDCYRLNLKYREYAQSLKFFLRQDSFDVHSNDSIHDVCRDQKDAPEMIQLLQEMIKEKPNDLHFYEFLGMCYTYIHDEANTTLYMNKARDLRDNSFNPVTKKNYLKLIESLKSHGAKGVFMQYPLWSVEPLKNMLKEVDGHEQFIFIDNDGLFQDLVKKESYETYFTNRRSGTWGHLTPKGKAVMAHNVAEHITDYFKTLSP